MAELADAADSKSAGLRPLGVRLPLPAPAAKPLTIQHLAKSTPFPMTALIPVQKCGLYPVMWHFFKIGEERRRAGIGQSFVRES
jgi:hypothetical protein